MDAVNPRMKRFCAVLFVLIASAAHAGVTYQFDSVTTGLTEQRMNGAVKAEGQNVRVEIVRGDGMFFGDGSLVLSTDGGKTLSVVDPKSRSYYVLDLNDLLANSVLQQFGSLFDIKVQNPRVAVRDRGAAGAMVGYPVRKSTVDSSYEFALKTLGERSTIRVQMTTDVWSTDRVPAEFTSFLQMRGFRTGIEAVDKVLAAQTGSIKGFPLKQITTTRVFMGPKPVTSTTTSTVTGLRQASFAPAQFALPAGYRKTGSPVEKLMKQFGR